MTFGELINYLRIKESVSRGELAKASGCTERDIFAYENTKREPRWSRALVIIHALGYDIAVTKKGKHDE